MAYKIPVKKHIPQKVSYVEETDNEYDKQAIKFLNDTNTKFSIKYLKHDKYFPDDKEARDIYKFKLEKDGKVYTGTFGQSIVGTQKGEIPRPYEILSSLSGDRFEGDHKEFCDTFGYDEDSRKGYAVYKAVVKENEGMKRLYSEEELDKLSEIQ